MSAPLKPGTLYLLPAPLHPYDAETWDPATLAQTMPARSLHLLAALPSFVVESERTALRLLSRLKDREAMGKVSLKVLDEHSSPEVIPGLLAEILDGADVGFFSEAGLPCVADPGAALVAEAHARGIRVVPVSGPSSLMLGLIASGLDAQRFSFLGYLPQDRAARRNSIQRLAGDFRRDGITRLFIETPYRNDALFSDFIALLPDEAWLCVAADLCGKGERIESKPVKSWKAAPAAPIGKVPAVFLFGNRAALRPRDTR